MVLKPLLEGDQQMNYFDELRGMLTETELKYVGLGLAHNILFGNYELDDDDESIGGDTTSSGSLTAPSIPAFDAARLKEAARIIAGVKSRSVIRAKLIHHLMLEETDAAIAAYFRRERIPIAYHAIVKQDDCIEILVRGIFYKVAMLPRKAALDAEVARLCTSLKANEDKLIAYERVGVLQRFVHEKLRLHGNASTVGRVRVEAMRCLLSVARLHLNLTDLQAHDPAYAVYMTEVSNARASLEYLNPSPPPPLVDGKHIYPRWRVRHLRPVSYFFRRKARRRLSVLLALDIDLPLVNYVEAACRAFALVSDAPEGSVR